MHKSRNILVVEDNPDIAHLVELHLRDQEMNVELASDGPTGLQKALSGKYDMVVLDLMLPGFNGLDICRAVRKQDAHTPILMLTARSSELDRVLGLEIGADDYLTKPFSVHELIARVKAIFRRVDAWDQEQGATDRSSEMLSLDKLVIDHQTRVVQLQGREIELTAKEFDLLWHFASNPGRVYTRTQLLDRVWGYGHDGYEHTVNSHINRLRAKIEEDPSQPRYVLTVWGVGYKFADRAKAGVS